MNAIPFIVHYIRKQARDIGYNAKNTHTNVLNPYSYEHPLYEHWNDGYSLGVKDAIFDRIEEIDYSLLEEDFGEYPE